MTACPGELVVHRDGAAWCSEVRAGRACLGTNRPHRAVWTCRLVWGPDDCPRCIPSVTAPDDVAPTLPAMTWP
jgi:hypothetical protein